ncbi:MAG: flavoprotein, partial [Actinomycetota bacterium]|nr:flavoprotein [Actinomycetota bacterium]
MKSEQQTVVVGVTGGIGAYKACELVRDLMRRGFRVKVVMTEAATRFVTPLTFRTLTGEPVAVSLWADEPDSKVHHISLAEEADVLVLAPCTANVIAKLAHGRA